MCLDSGDSAGALQAGRDQLHGPGLGQGGELCEGKPAAPTCVLGVEALHLLRPHMLKVVALPQVKSLEKDRQFEKRIPEGDLADHIIQKCRNKLFEERNLR